MKTLSIVIMDVQQGMTIEQVMSFLNPLFFQIGDNFKGVHKRILSYSWEGKGYEEMLDLGYSIGYIKTNLAPELWGQLTKLLRETSLIEANEKVTKKNLKLVIEPIVKRYTAHDLVNQVIANRFKIVSLKSRGDFSYTYFGEDLQNNQQCFIKQLRLNSNARIQRNFDREAGALYQLGWHRQIPGLLAHFEDESGYFLVHEFIRGIPLSQKLSESKTSQPWSEEEVINLVRTVLNILQFVHLKNIIHRDIKPSNLIETPDGDIVLINFGSVKQIDNSNNRSFLGTPGYAAPEQLYGMPRQCSDIFSLSMVAIQALTGLPPTEFKIDAEKGGILWLETGCLSKKFAAILNKMAQYDFHNRYQLVCEVVKDWKKLL